jgi:hypothetical protein
MPYFVPLPVPAYVRVSRNWNELRVIRLAHPFDEMVE